MTEPMNDSLIAIVGMAGRFPGAADVDELWRNLIAGASGLREITDAELAAAGVDPALVADPDYVRVGGPVAGIEEFDAAAFGFSAREAETMEPHHRLLLECSWEALERAGYCPTDPGCPVGVFAGCAFPDYLIDNVPHLGGEPGGKQYLAAGVERDSLSSLVSYKLGLHGPSLTVQTYCSTSLVAVHLACQSLLTYECDMALAGGACLPLPQPAGYLYEDGGILSPDGQVRSLDAAANGTVLGSGGAVVALKRLTDALADGDVVHAVILGSAVNNDGRDRAGYGAPGVGGQAAVIDTALAVAGVKPESVGYVECHAVGTPLGDSIELAALNRVFGTPRETACVLSSVKPSVGHLDRAAGVTGLMRAALNLRHELLPGTPGFATPNPTLAAAANRFTVLTENRHWPTGPDPRRAGVNSFGVGGTNAHVVLEQAPPRPPRPVRSGPHLLTFSAGDPAALSALTDRLRGHLVAHPEDDLADVAYTLGVSRGRFALRRAVVCDDRDDAIAALADPRRWLDGETRRRDPRVRLVAGDGTPAEWVAELSDACHRLLPADDKAAERDGVLAAGLERIGVRTAADAAPGVVDVVVEPGDGSAATWVLSTVARLWQAGVSIDWAALHRGAGRRVELPTYPFQRRRHWIDASTETPAVPTVPARSATLLPTWRRHPLPVTELAQRLRDAGPWLLFAGDERGEALARRLVHAGTEVTVVRPGAGFESHETGDFTIRPADPDDLAELLRSLIVAPRTVVHGFSLATPDGDGVAHFTAAQELGAISGSALVRALAEDTVLPPAELILLTAGAVGVLDSDLAHPEHAALGVLPCRQVDLGVDADLDQALACAVHTHEGPLAVRGGETWSRCHEPHALAEPDPTLPQIQPSDTVLITGDGLAVARHLANTYGCRLVLTTPPALDDDLHDLEERGAAVLAVPAELGDETRLRAAVQSAVDAFGGVDLVVHVPAGEPAAVVRDFHVLQSVLGEHAAAGRIALCEPENAVDAVVAAYARVARRRGQGRWLVAGCDPGSTGMFDRLLAAAGHLAHVVVATGPVEPRRATSAADGPVGETGERARRPRPALATPYVEPEAGLERAVAEVVAAGLGFDDIGADDNFFELGGRSAAAVQIASRLRDEYSTALPLTALVAYPTVRLLCGELTALTA